MGNRVEKMGYTILGTRGIGSTCEGVLKRGQCGQTRCGTV